MPFPPFQKPFGLGAQPIPKNPLGFLVNLWFFFPSKNPKGLTQAEGLGSRQKTGAPKSKGLSKNPKGVFGRIKKKPKVFFGGRSKAQRAFGAYVFWKITQAFWTQAFGLGSALGKNQPLPAFGR